MAARGLTFAARLFTGGGKTSRPSRYSSGAYTSEEMDDLAPDLEQGSESRRESEESPAAVYGARAKNALGLEGVPSPR